MPRAGLALWVVLCLLFQSLVVARHDVAMSAGDEVCSAEGAKRVDAQGQPLADDSHHDHACCFAADLAAPPAVCDAHGGEPVAAGPARALPAGWMSAHWAAPRSRGPPVPGST